MRSGRGIPKISTGDILREAVTTGTEIGLRAKAIMDRGELVSDDVMIGIVRERLIVTMRAGFILDGFPRTVAQAAALDGLMAGREPLVVIDIVVPESGTGAAAGSRVVCSNAGRTPRVAPPARAGARCRHCGGRLVQRADDNEAVVLERSEGLSPEDAAAGRLLPRRPTFRSVDGSQPPHLVAADLAAAMTGARRVGREGARDRLPVGCGAREDARGGPAGRRSADRAAAMSRRV